MDKRSGRAISIDDAGGNVRADAMRATIHGRPTSVPPLSDTISLTARQRARADRPELPGFDL